MNLRLSLGFCYLLKMLQLAVPAIFRPRKGVLFEFLAVDTFHLHIFYIHAELRRIVFKKLRSQHLDALIKIKEIQMCNSDIQLCIAYRSQISVIVKFK